MNTCIESSVNSRKYPGFSPGMASQTSERYRAKRASETGTSFRRMRSRTVVRCGEV